jgi:hypothetical protein
MDATAIDVAGVPERGRSGYYRCLADIYIHATNILISEPVRGKRYMADAQVAVAICADQTLNLC